MATSRSDQSSVPRGPDTDVFGGDEPGSGWLFFAGTVLGLAGLMRLVDSFWAFRYNGALPDSLQDGVLGSNLDNYAWAWLIVGIILIVASVMLMTRSQFARWIGYIAAGIGALERDHLDAVLSDLGDDLHLDRAAGFLCPRAIRRTQCLRKRTSWDRSAT